MTPSILLGNHTPFGILRIYYLDEISSIVPWEKRALKRYLGMFDLKNARPPLTSPSPTFLGAAYLEQRPELSPRPLA